MRKIELGMIEAIDTFQPYKNDNTSVVMMDDEGVDKLYVFLHNNLIAITDCCDELFIKDSGYQTKTTKSRLNAILRHFGFPLIYSKKKQWCIGDEVWTGNKTFDIPQKEMVTVMKAWIN